MKNAAERVVYVLIYPAILASMIYEFFDLVGHQQTDGLTMLGLALITLVYLFDFATNEGATSDLGQGANSGLGMVVDVFAAILFCAAFQATALRYYTLSLSLLIFTSISFFVYNSFKSQNFSLRIWLTIVAMGGVLGTRTFQDITIWHLLVGEVLMIIAYILYGMVVFKNPTQ